MSEPPLSPATRARVLVPFAICTLIWSSTWLVIRDQIGVVPPAWSICYRFLLAGIAMAAYGAVTRQSLRLDRDGIRLALWIGLLQFALNYNFVYEAEVHVTSGLVAMLFALLVVPNAILARIFLGQRISWPFFIGSAVAITGVALLFSREMGPAVAHSGSIMLGLGMTLLSVISASIANVMQASKAASRSAIVPVLCWAMLSGAAIDGAYAWVVAGPPVVEWRWGYLAGILYLALAGSTLAFALYFQVTRTIGPARAAYSSVLVPVIAMLLSTVFEGYRWSLPAVAGAVLVFAGLVIALRARNPVAKSG